MADEGKTTCTQDPAVCTFKNRKHQCIVSTGGRQCLKYKEEKKAAQEPQGQLKIKFEEV